MTLNSRSIAWLGVALLLAAGLLAGSGCGAGGGGNGGASGVLPYTGRAALGPLSGALVEIYEVQPGAVFSLRFQETSHVGADVATTGLFNAHHEALTDGNLYLIRVQGGQDVDTDNDGVLDAAPTPNNGVIHAVGTGAQLKAGAYQVNALTEIAYQGIRYLLMAGYDASAVVDGLDTYAEFLLTSDVSGDGRIDAADLLAWDPRLHQSALRKDYSHYANLLEAIRSDDTADALKCATKLADISAAYTTGFDKLEDVVTAGSYAYVAAHSDGIRILDISNPRLPTEVMTVDTNEADGVCLVGNLLFVADDDGLQIVDVTNPLSPVKRGKAFGGPGDEMEWADDVVVSGNYAYVADGENGRLRVIDVSDPDAPVLVATHETGRGWGDGVAIYGDYVYLADDDGVSVVDVTDPAHPSGLTQVDTAGDADEVVVSGGILYVASGDNGGLTIFGLTDPTVPVEIASADAPMDCEGIAVLGDYAYLSQRDAGLQIIDVSDPADPVSLGICTVFGEGNSLCCHGDYVLMAMEDEGGLRILDVNPHSATLFTSTLSLPVVAELDFDTDGIVTDGRYAYAVSEGKVVSVDLLDPTQPVEIDGIDIIGAMNGAPTRAALEGNRLYVTMGWRGVQIVDVSTPTAMVKHAHYDEHLGPQHITVDVAAQGDHIFTAETHHPRFLSINVTDPDNPFHAGDQSGPHHGLRGVAMLGSDHVCTAWGFAGIQVVDVTTPGDPQIVGDSTLPAGVPDPEDANHVSHIGVNGSYAYITGGEGVYIVDVGTPTSPTIAGHLDGPEGNDFAFSGSHLFLSSWHRGVSIANVADPANPWVVARVPIRGEARGIAVLGDYLLVGTGGRFQVIRRPLTETLP